MLYLVTFRDKSLDVRIIKCFLLAQMGKITVTVFIPEEVKEDLKKLAESEQRSLSQMAAILIQQGLDKAKAERKIQ